MVLSYDVLSSLLAAQHDPRSIFYTHSSPSCPAINGGFSGHITADPWFMDQVAYQHTQPPTIPPQPPPLSYYQNVSAEPVPVSPQYSSYPQNYLPTFPHHSSPPHRTYAQHHNPTRPNPKSAPTFTQKHNPTFTMFNGEHPDLWLLNVELYFMFHPYPLEIRFHIIAMYLEGKALTWFRLWEHQLDSWDKFKEVFTFQFGNPISEHWEESSAPVLDSTTVVVSSGQSKHHFPQPSTNLTEAEFDESDDSSSHEEDNLLENAEQVQNLEDPNHLVELCFEDVSEVLSDGLSIQISTQECPLSDKINNGLFSHWLSFKYLV
ncbi:uncharacterized protein LOC130737464 isoform X2 [Lotus japonicus]|uniref:uncharacterized protein LOC130737464 isoform X2 n=1 Tax=Lotus japonicus TaxID=34305 RepID=UPI002587CC05|nr:uncharacterized protein LOC130737464 isoform X2 [Lotus japonicus]